MPRNLFEADDLDDDDSLDDGFGFEEDHDIDWGDDEDDEEEEDDFNSHLERRPAHEYDEYEGHHREDYFG